MQKINLEWVGEAIGEYLEKRQAPKNEEGAQHSSSTEQDRYKWMTDKEIHEEKFKASSLHCSHCDYTPCRCKNEDYEKKP